MLTKRKVLMNSTQKTSKIKRMAYQYGEPVKKMSRPTRIFISDIFLATLSVAWLVEHLQDMTRGLEIFFASIFVGLVLYFKHKA